MLPSLPHLLQVVQVVFHRYFLGSRHSTQVSLSHNNNIKPGIVTSCRHALICKVKVSMYYYIQYIEQPQRNTYIVHQH